MGVRCSLQEVDEAEFHDLLANPETIYDLEEKWAEEEDEESHGGVSLDKAWHGIHYLLTGSDWGGAEPLCFLLEGGKQIGEEDSDYRVFLPGQVKVWADALSKISPDELRERFDPKAMTAADIYPAIWDRSTEEEDALGYLLEHYEILRSFLIQARNENKGVIVSIS